MVLTYDFDGKEFEFEPCYKDVTKALAKIMMDGCKRRECDLFEESGAYQMAIYVIDTLDFLDNLVETYEEELMEYFEDVARREFNALADDEKEWLADWRRNA